MAALINEGADPASIVAFTFTERAAAELNERITRRVAEVKGRDFLDRLGPMFVGTIHSYCFRVLQEHVPKYGNYDVLDEHRHVGLLSREYFNLGLSKLGKLRSTDRWIETVDIIGNELIDASDLKGDVAEIYTAYREMLDRYHCLTFSLVIQCAVESLQEKAIFKSVHGPLRHLVVDEYQDINPAQEKLIELLSKPPVQLCVVGDDDQCIYEWRGSQVSNILNFAKRRKGSTTLPLTDNRRSRPDIVETANRFAKLIPERLPKTMRAKRDKGSHEVVAWKAPTPDEEAKRIAETIERLHALGYRYRDIAILCRSVRTSAPPIIDALKGRGIPVSCGGRTGLFLQPEINLFGEIFAWFVDGEWKDERWAERRQADLDHIVAGLDALFGGGRKIPGLRKYLEDWKAYRLRGIEPVSLVGDYYKLLFKLGAQKLDVDTAMGSTRFGSFARFSTILADFEHTYRRGRYVNEEKGIRWRGGRDRGKEYFQSLQRYLIYYARDAYDDFEGEMLVDTDAVDVLTVHQAKGLEWPIVFMPALVNRRFPTSRTGEARDWLLPDDVLTEAIKKRYQGSIDEERRLFYVAMTRARDCAYLSCFERIHNRTKPSPFFEDVAGKKVIETELLPLPGPPEAAKDEEAPPLQVSFSDIAVFEECGYRYRLANQLGFEQEIAVELGYGKALHHVLRRVADTARDTGKIPSSAQLQKLVEDEFYLPLADKPAFDRMFNAGHRLVRRYVTDYSDDLRRVWATERPFALHLEDGLIAGRADVILDEENGRPGSLALVDYKVATAEERDERYQHQLQIYAVAGRGEGLNVEAAYLHELRTGKRSAVAIAPNATQKAVAQAASSVKQIRRGAFKASPSKHKCRACDYNRVCRHTAHDPE
ncbi:MAG: hypothetical protein A2133_07265 [Actinobacteria bacterium RBG_16_64_13]|nr:MAG: hypothetical protein A2133_07265 [Actinobacteria bacterium RBG_16_64_13]